MAMIDYKTLLTSLIDGETLSPEAMQAMMHGILSGEWTPAQTAGALIALKVKGEKPSEIAAAAEVMRQFATAVTVDSDEVIDTCGTGGDGSGTFNISTTTAFVVAACGVPVAKHGNRAMSGASGSSDVLEKLGMPLTLSAERVAQLIKSVGIGFMFAPNHHAAMKHAVPVRRELGVRTLFNLLGPLTNPAGAKRQVIGVFAQDLLLPYAETLATLGAKHAMVVHGDGLDEVAISAPTNIAELKEGTIVRYTIAPEDVGLQRAEISAIQVTSIEESQQMLLSVLEGATGAARDIVLLNAAAGLMVADKVADFSAGVAMAAQAIDDGRARNKLQEFIRASNA